MRLTPEGQKQKLEQMYIKSRVIRYVHFTPKVDPAALIEQKRREHYEVGWCTLNLQQSLKAVRHIQLQP